MARSKIPSWGVNVGCKPMAASRAEGAGPGVWGWIPAADATAWEWASGADTVCVRAVRGNRHGSARHHWGGRHWGGGFLSFFFLFSFFIY